jgi:hypothetical protein
VLCPFSLRLSRRLSVSQIIAEVYTLGQYSWKCYIFDVVLFEIERMDKFLIERQKLYESESNAEDTDSIL